MQTKFYTDNANRYAIGSTIESEDGATGKVVARVAHDTLLVEWDEPTFIVATPEKVATIAAEVGVTESQVQGIIDFENAQRKPENAQVIKCHKCNRVQPAGNAEFVAWSDISYQFVGWCAECVIDIERDIQYQMSTDNDAVAIALPGYDWDWCLDALAKSKAEDAKRIATTIKACIILPPNSGYRFTQSLFLSRDNAKFLLDAFDAYLPWETPEVREDLRDLMETISKQIAPKVTA